MSCIPYVFYWDEKGNINKGDEIKISDAGVTITTDKITETIQYGFICLFKTENSGFFSLYEEIKDSNMERFDKAKDFIKGSNLQGVMPVIITTSENKEYLAFRTTEEAVKDSEEEAGESLKTALYNFNKKTEA